MSATRDAGADLFVIANSELARVYERCESNSLTLLSTLQRSPGANAPQEAAQDLTEAVAAHVQAAAADGRYARVALFAPQPALRRIKERLSGRAKRILVAIVDCDLTGFSMNEMERIVTTALPRSSRGG